MDSRRRGATWLLAALVLGRALDAFDLPFERRPAIAGVEPGPAGERSASAESTGVPFQPATLPAPSADGRVGRPGGAPPSSAEPVRVNRATATELQGLPGVGPVLASRIVAERDAHGPFHTAADLGRVKGIGAKTCVRLAPHLRFD